MIQLIVYTGFLLSCQGDGEPGDGNSDLIQHFSLLLRGGEREKGEKEGEEETREYNDRCECKSKR